MHDELAAPTADGATLRIDRVRAYGSPRGALVCLHAMMTDGRYFGARRAGSFARTIAAAGFDVFVADFRGHGRSVPPRAGPDDWSFDDLVEFDLPAIVAAAADAAACPPSQLTLLGHSLGGLVATAALGTGRIPPPRALLLAATGPWLPGPHGHLHRRAIFGTYRHLTALFGRAPIRALRIGNADEAATYVEQLTGWARAGRWTSLRGVDYLAALASITTPTLAAVSARDWMCTPHDAISFVERIPSHAQPRIVGRTYGDPVDANHFELITRPELHPLWLDLLARAAEE